jgi:NAD(P)-dependent dehydrogenase (short-subunit alcohol dehydrogenase family)
MSPPHMSQLTTSSKKASRYYPIFVSRSSVPPLTGLGDYAAAVNQIHNNNVTSVQGDVSNLADPDRLYDTVKQQKGRIDILFANADIAEFAPLGSISESHFDKIFSVNVKGLLFTVQKALPLFQDFYHSHCFGRRIQRVREG